jgi:nitrile hydratase accessory protein
MSDTQQALVAQLPASIKVESEPVFTEPWQAQAFAIAVALLRNKSFTWSEWAATLGEEIAGAARHGIVEDGSAYYELWLRALERLVDAKQLSDQQELSRLQKSWRTAYANTPHGQAVTLPPHQTVDHHREQP